MRSVAEAVDHPLDEDAPCFGIGNGQACSPLEQEAESYRPNEEDDRFRIDVTGYRSVDRCSLDERLHGCPQCDSGLRNGSCDLRLTTRGDEGFETNGLPVVQLAARHPPHLGNEICHPGPPGFTQVRHLTGLLDDCRPQEIALGPKAAIDGPGRETGLTDDVHDLGPVVALSGEDTGRGSEQALADGVFSTARGGISLRDEIDVHGVENKVYSGLGQGSHHQSRMISVDGTVHEPNWLRYTERLARFCRRWRFDAAGLGPPDRLPVNAQKPRAGRRRNCANDDAPRGRTTPSASKLRRSRGLDESGFGRGLVYGRLPYRSSRAHRQEARDTDTDTGDDGPAQSVHPRGTAVRGHLRRRRSSQHLPNDLENTLGGETGERSQARVTPFQLYFLTNGTLTSLPRRRLTCTCAAKPDDRETRRPD